MTEYSDVNAEFLPLAVIERASEPGVVTLYACKTCSAVVTYFCRDSHLEWHAELILTLDRRTS